MSGPQAHFAHAANCESGGNLGVRGVQRSSHGETLGTNRDLCASALHAYTDSYTRVALSGAGNRDRRRIRVCPARPECSMSRTIPCCGR